MLTRRLPPASSVYWCARQHSRLNQQAMESANLEEALSIIRRLPKSGGFRRLQPLDRESERMLMLSDRDDGREEEVEEEEREEEKANGHPFC